MIIIIIIISFFGRRTLKSHAEVIKVAAPQQTSQTIVYLKYRAFVNNNEILYYLHLYYCMVSQKKKTIDNGILILRIY